MNISKLPETLTINEVEALRKAFGHFYDQEVTSKFVDPKTGMRFDNVAVFVDYLYSPEIGIPKGTSAKYIGITLESWYETLSRGPEYSEPTTTKNVYTAESNTLTPGQREEFEKERVERIESQQKAVADAKIEVEAAIKRQQKIQEALKNKKVYAKVEATETALQPNENTANFIDQAKKYPAAFEKDLAENIKTTITPTLKDALAAEEIDLIAQKTAYDTVYAINNPQAQESANVQVSILNNLSKNPEIISKVISDKNAASLIEKALPGVEYFKDGSQLSRTLLSSVNKNLATSVFGLGPEGYKVSFYYEPVEGYTHELDFGKLNEGYVNLLQSQSDTFSNIGSRAGGQAKSFLLSQARTFLDSQVAKLPVNSLVRGLYNSKFGQTVLKLVGLGGKTSIGNTIFSTIVQRFPGSSVFLQGVGKIFGFSFGIGGGAGASVGGVTGATIITSEGVALATGAGIETGIAATGAAIGTAEAAAAGAVAGGAGAGAGSGFLAGIGTGPGAIITAIIGAIVGWLASKINWKKVKENLPIILAFVFGFLTFGFLGPLPGIIVGVVIFSVVTIIVKGAALGSIGAGVAGFFGGLGALVFSVIGLPVLIILLTIPVVVVIILFIINSGAYVVPPSTSTYFIGSIHCSEEKVATGINYTSISPIARRARDIVDDLYQGFWCYWNRSPKAPSEYFPRDVLLHPPGYPDLFDYKLFLTDPNPPEETGPNLFWCTDLVIKSYNENGDTLGTNLLNSQDMFNDFKNRGKGLDAAKATPANIVPGSVVFFHVTTGPNRLNHVAIVYSVDMGGIVVVESNAPLKTQTINFNASGVGVGNLPEMEVQEFGLP